MATNPLTFTLSPGMAPAAPLMRMLSRFDRAKLEAFAEISVAFLDILDAPDDPDEPAFQMQLDDGQPGDRDDAEDDDPREEDDDPAQCSEDEISCGRSTFGRAGAGCELSDPGGDEHDGREPEDCF